MSATVIPAQSPAGLVLHFAAIPILLSEAFRLRDTGDWTLPVKATPRPSWKLVALAGGAPVLLFCECDGRVLLEGLA